MSTQEASGFSDSLKAKGGAFDGPFIFSGVNAFLVEWETVFLEQKVPQVSGHPVISCLRWAPNTHAAVINQPQGYSSHPSKKEIPQPKSIDSGSEL